MVKLKQVTKKVNDKSVRYRYFLASDSSDEVTEIKKEMYDELEDKGLETEDIDEDDVVIEEETPGVEEKKDGRNEEVPATEKPVSGITDPASNKLDAELGEEITKIHTEAEEANAANKEPIPGVNKQEAEQPKLDEDDEDGDTIFEVDLGEGIIGKMDENAYNYTKRFVDMQKKGDAMENAVKLMSLAAKASRVLGKEFDKVVDSYVVNGKFDEKKLKRDVIKKQMPNIVVTSLKNDEALNSMFECAVATSIENVNSWEHDVRVLATAVKASDTAAKKDIVKEAREARLKKINNIK